MKQISRRQALKLIGVTAVGGVLAACATATTALARQRLLHGLLPTARACRNHRAQRIRLCRLPQQWCLRLPPANPLRSLLWMPGSASPSSRRGRSRNEGDLAEDAGRWGQCRLIGMILADYTPSSLLYASGADFVFAFDAPGTR